ncbi:MAG: NusG domain II-containing protein [Lachnospiraceae bacterium]|jgi:hypothetical protein
MKNKRELILIAVLIVIAAAWFTGQKILFSAPAAYAQVTVDGDVVQTLDLAKDIEITITGKQGGSNLLVIRDGEIWCASASCPDKVCVSQGKKSHNGDTIACLPNRMIVTIVAQ